MHCFYHQDREAVGMCKSCGKGLCGECAADLNKGLACRSRCEEDARAVIELIDRNIQLATASTKAHLVVPAAVQRTGQPADYIAAQLTSHIREARHFRWGVGVFCLVVGVILLVLTLLLSFSGYLLPWDQLAIWAVTVGTNMARATPLLGHEGPFGAELGMRINNDVRFVLLGGTEVGPPTLLRFYVGHCIFLPLIATIFMIVHLWRVRKDGGISGPESKKNV